MNWPFQMPETIRKHAEGLFAITKNVFNARVNFEKGYEIVQLGVFDRRIRRAVSQAAFIHIPQRDVMFQKPVKPPGVVPI